MKKFIFILSLIITYALTPSQAIAASQDECAIWICLPGGFPSGCGAAKSALKDRIMHRKSPLPNFSSCAVNPPNGSGSHMSSNYGWAAYFPTRTICTAYAKISDEKICVDSKTIKAHHQKNATCRDDDDGPNLPIGCTGNSRWAEVYIDGRLTGPTYYWDFRRVF